MLAGSLVARQVSLIATLAEEESKVQALKLLKAGVISQGAGSSRLVSLAIVYLQAERRKFRSVNTCDLLVVVRWYSSRRKPAGLHASVWTLVRSRQIAALLLRPLAPP